MRHNFGGSSSQSEGKKEVEFGAPSLRTLRSKFDAWAGEELAHKTIGTGVNYPHVRQVILFGQPDSLSLTAGRDGFPAEICSGYQDCRNTECGA
jgi:hypothetical protein